MNSHIQTETHKHSLVGLHILNFILFYFISPFIHCFMTFGENYAYICNTLIKGPNAQRMGILCTR